MDLEKAASLALNFASPIGAAVVVAWYCLRHITRQHEKHLEDIRGLVREIKEVQAAHLASKEAEANRLGSYIETIQKEKDVLRGIVGERRGGKP